ncbi:MAG: DUF2304 family protein [Patescibacteria group bacterium]
MVIQVILLVFIFFAILRTVERYRDRAIPVRWLLFWVLFWGVVAVAVLVPKTTEYLARLVGVGRGVDAVLYFAIVTLFYLVFRVFVRVERMESDLTKIVRELALKKEREENSNDKTQSPK